MTIHHEGVAEYENTNIDKVLLWEVIKMKIRSATIHYSINKKKDRKKREVELEHRIKELEQREQTESEIEELESIKGEMNKIIEKR